MASIKYPPHISTAAKRFEALTVRARRRGMILKKPCACIYVLKGDIPGQPIIMETLDIDAIETVINYIKRIEQWNAQDVRKHLANSRCKKAE